MNSTHKTGKMAHVLLAINIIPLFFFGVAVLFLATGLFTKAMYTEVETELRSAANNVAYMLDLAFPGDYELMGASSLRLYKGEYDLTTQQQIVDQIQEDTGLDVTLFYKDTRILTTIRNTDGTRIIGTAAPSIVLKDVLNTGSPRFYANTRIYGTEYFCYYSPLRNTDGTIAGMLFVGKPSSRVDEAIRRASYPLVAAVLLVAALITFCLFLYTRKFDVVLQEIRSFLSNISTENLTAELSGIVLKRNDEFGDIGRSAALMQQALRHTIEQDTLTELYNRRSGDRRLRQIIERSSTAGTPFCVCIGDIDYFKSVNDTYGHDCGDVVLRKMADVLKEHMNARGFAARWGGEEFLLVFDRMEMEGAHASLNELLEKIRSTEIPYDDRMIHVTMTFGLTKGEGVDYNTLLRNADEKLYEGKAAGRNRVVM